MSHPKNKQSRLPSGGQIQIPVRSGSRQGIVYKQCVICINDPKNPVATKTKRKKKEKKRKTEKKKNQKEKNKRKVNKEIKRKDCYLINKLYRARAYA